MNSAPPVSSQKRTCHVPYSTTHVCVAFTACADAAAVSAPSRARPTERCAQDPSRILVEAHVLVAVAARRVRVRKHSPVEQRSWLCGGDCHVSVSLRTQCGSTVPIAAHTPPR
jgi:hypothetical protein